MTNSYLWTIYSVFYDTLTKFIPYKELVVLVASSLNVSDGDRILDIGSGTGNFEKEITNAGKKATIVGVDNSNEMLGRSRKKCPEYEYLKYDVNKYLLPFKDEEFEKAVSINVVYNVEDLQKFFSDVNRVLKKEGLFVFTTSTNAGLSSVIMQHIKSMNFKSFIISVLYLPMWIFVILINVFIDKKFKHYFYSEKNLIKSLELTGFKVSESTGCYGGLNKLITAKKITNV